MFIRLSNTTNSGSSAPLQLCSFSREPLALCLTGAFLWITRVSPSPRRFQLTVEVFDYMDAELRLAETGEKAPLLPYLPFPSLPPHPRMGNLSSWAVACCCCYCWHYLFMYQCQGPVKERFIVNTCFPFQRVFSHTSIVFFLSHSDPSKLTSDQQSYFKTFDPYWSSSLSILLKSTEIFFWDTLAQMRSQ